MKQKILPGILTTLLSLAPISSYAGILVDKGFDPGNSISGTYIDGSEGSPDLFDDFSLASASNITDITFWGSYWSSGEIPAVEDVRVRIETRSGTTRAGLLYDAAFGFVRTDTGLDHNDFDGADIWAFSGGGFDFDLAPGDYWLSFYLDTVAPDVDLIWQRSAESAPIGVYGTHGYSSGFGDYSFVLESNTANVDVPVPAPLFLFGLGIAGLAFASRRSVA